MSGAHANTTLTRPQLEDVRLLVGSFNEAEGMSSRSARDARRISKLLRKPVRCPHCGQPAWVMATKGDLAEVHCLKCGMFELPVKKLKIA